MGGNTMAITLTAESMAWVEAMASNGLIVVDSHGRGDFSPKAKELISALHEVLAGGQVEVVVQGKGDPSKREMLDGRLKRFLGAISATMSDIADGYSP
jgi:ribosomal protein L4